MNRTALATGLLFAAATATFVALAGPLHPPAGPIVSTNKTLQEVFDKVAATEARIAINPTNTPGDADSLFRITAPGSYFLTGNVTGIVGKHGIEIAAGGVTIDLAGFDLAGVPAMGAFDGVAVTFPANITNITVRNGSVRGWGGDGVDLQSFGPTNCRADGVLASGNGGSGIAMGIGSTVTNCAARSNSAYGISVNDLSTITGSTASSNAFTGISTGLGCTITACTAGGNAGNGFSASSGCTVIGCTAYNNGENGLSTSNGSTIADSTFRSNSLNGITCAAACVIRTNTCTSNGVFDDGAGIFATGSDNRIEGNSCTGADRGIDVNGAGNVIIRNTCSGNTNNWDVVAGNFILVINATAAALVTGNSGGTALGSTDPNANFSY